MPNDNGRRTDAAALQTILWISSAGREGEPVDIETLPKSYVQEIDDTERLALITMIAAIQRDTRE